MIARRWHQWNHHDLASRGTIAIPIVQQIRLCARVTAAIKFRPFNDGKNLLDIFGS